MSPLSAYLRAQRLNLGLSKVDIAKRSKKYFSYIQKLEDGVRTPRIETLPNLAKAYSVSEDELKKVWFDTQVIEIWTRLNLRGKPPKLSSSYIEEIKKIQEIELKLAKSLKNIRDIHSKK